MIRDVSQEDWETSSILGVEKDVKVRKMHGGVVQTGLVEDPSEVHMAYLAIQEWLRLVCEASLEVVPTSRPPQLPLPAVLEAVSWTLVLDLGSHMVEEAALHRHLLVY